MTLLFLVLSGLATGASWLCYFHALQKGDINKVVPIDKSSTILTILLALIFFMKPVLGKSGLCLSDRNRNHDDDNQKGNDR